MTYTDAELKAMEKELGQIYSEAQNELQAQWDAYMQKAKAKTDGLYKKLESAMLTGAPDEMAKAKDAWEKATYNVTLKDKHYHEMVDQVTSKLAATNEIALGYLNNEMPKIYCHSYNDFADEHIKGYSFEMVDESTVENLVKNGATNLLPQKQVNIPKDKQWNTKNINSQVLQGILQGESISKLSKRLENVTDMNHKSAIRNARTMTTGAECKGRMDSYHKAQEDGVILKKVWVAHHSERTREWHGDLGGVAKDIDEPFENDYGEIMYPGDPTAHPANVYNCRCSIKTKILGFKPMKPAQTQTVASMAEQYKGVSVTAQYYSMLNENKAVGNEFWKALNAEGKPSTVWKDYLAGNLPKDTTTKLDGILAKYKGTGQPIKPGKIKPAPVVEPPKPKPDLTIYQDKSMTATYYSVKAEDKNLGKEFWDILQNEDHPSVIWNQYVAGIAPQEVTEKLDAILLQHKGTGAWSKPVGAKAAAKKAAKQAASTGDDLLKYKKDLPDNLIDAKNITFAKNEDDWKKIQSVIIDSKDNSETWAEYWYKYVKGDVENTELDKILLPQFKKMAKAEAKAAAKAAADADNLLKAKEQLAVAQGNLDSLGNKTYSGIWKQDVTLSEYESKAASIQAKKDYYYKQIEDLVHSIDAGDITEAAGQAKIKQFEKYVEDLKEFETKGQLYVQYKAEYDKIAKEVKALTPVSDMFGPEAYTQARKDAAKWYTRATYSEGDKYYTKTLGEAHKQATQAEKRAYYSYTSASGGFNRPLAGFDAYSGSGSSGWSEKNYKGPGKVSLNNEGKGKEIKDLTSFIEKSITQDDIWIQTAQNYATLEGKHGFLGIDYGTLQHMTDKELQQFVGTTSEFTQFISGSINRGGGSYTPGSMRINIYVPEGSEALYVLSDGAFGKAEHEIILQRGGTYRITKIYWGEDIEQGGRKLMVDMELLTGQGYNKFE